MELFRLLGTVAIDKGKAIAGLNEVTDKAKTTSEKMSTSFKTIGEKSIELGKKMAVMSAGAGAAMGGMIKAAADVKAQNAQFEASFGSLQGKANKVFESMAKDTGILATRLKVEGTKAFSQFKGAGLDASDALKQTDKFTRLAADGAAYYDMSLEETSELMRSFIRGNTEAGDRIGLFTSETQRNQRAVEMLGKKYLDCTEAEKQMVMMDIASSIYETSGAMGQAAREADGWENVMGNFKESVRQFAASLGELILPAVTKFVQGATDFILKLQDMNKGAKIAIVAIMGIATAASPVLIVFGHMMKTVGQMIEGYKKLSPILKTASNNIKTFSSSALASTAATVRDTAAKGLNAVATSKVGTAASSSAKKVLMFASAHKVAMIAALGLAAPIIALAGYMLTTGASAEETASMITAFSNKLAVMIIEFANNLPAMINAIMPAITNVIQSVVATLPVLIPVLIQAGIKLFMALVKSLNEIIPPLVAALPKIVQAVVQALPVLIPALIKAGVTLFTALVKAIPKVVKVLIKSLPQIVKAIKTGLADGCKKVWDLIEKAASEKWEEIKEKITEPIEVAKEFVSKKVQQIKDAFDFSRLVSSVKTVWNNVKDNITNAIEKARDLVDSKVGSIKKYLSFSGLASTVKSIWNDIKTKITDPINSARDFVSDKVGSIKKYLSFSGLVSTVKKEWNDIKEKITDPITSAKDKISDIISKIKKKFPFNIGKIFNLKLPTIGVVWSKTSGLLNKAGIKKLPSLKVTWHAKGAIFDQPTIFATPQGLQGVGEAGAEAVTPIDKLQDYVSTAVASQNSVLVAVLNEILEAIKTMDAGVYDKIENALDNRKIQWNDRELGRFVKNYA